MSTEDAGHAEVALPKGVSVDVAGRTLTVTGPKGRVVRPFPGDVLHLRSGGGKLTLELGLPVHRKRSRALLRTWVAHLENLTEGLSRGFEARLKVVAAHFPMKVSVKGDELVIENFLGEKYPRTTRLVAGTTAKVDGEFVTIEGYDIEHVGQSAAAIERTTRIRDYDPRVFQDGIYLVERAHLKEAS
ncbi:MAG TPA: 50S ribosomal protein L6 [Thermoplasmata archaeon]|nr:50S ribosomal protein L6 [Thermoplasmata archaeon]